MAAEHRNPQTATAGKVSHKLVRKRQRDTEELVPIIWGHFDATFETYGRTGPNELLTFLKQLDGLASWASTRQSILSPLYEPYRKKRTGHGAVSRYEILPNILTAYDHPREDIIQLASEDDLSQWLGRGFNKPLFYRASQAESAINAKSISIKVFWEMYRERPDKRVYVYDYAKDDPDDRTYQMTVRNLLQRFDGSRGDSTALNLLDIKNELGEYCPTPLRYHNATECLSRRKSAISRDTNYAKSTHKEFFLWSEAGAMSTIHIDTGGDLTWVMVMGGRKIWYFARDFTPDDLNWLACSGSQTPEGYPRGWARVEIQKGDLLVMPPGCPHAVFTPDDCLAVGGHFYTTAHLASTLRVLKKQERYPDICNESLKADTYKELGRVVDGLCRSGSRDELNVAQRGAGDWHDAVDAIPQAAADHESIRSARATFIQRVNELDKANRELYE